jgi:plastocyanin
MEHETIVSPDFKKPNRRKLLLLLTGLGILLILLVGIWLATRSRSSQSIPHSEVTLSKEEVKIDIQADRFIPATIKVKPGTTITWVNKDTKPYSIAADPHPTHSSLPGLVGDDLNEADTYSYVFEKPGTYTYHNEQLPMTMRGTVIVEN